MKLTKYPKRGDIVLKTIEGKKPVYAQIDSFVLADVDTAKYEIIGAVADIVDGKALVVYKTNAAKAWCVRRAYTLTGYTLDGTSRTGAISMRENSSASANVDTTFTYSANSVQELCDQLNTQFNANPTYKAQDWYAEVVDGAVMVSFDWTFSNQSNNTAKSGFTATLNILPDVLAVAKIRRKSGYEGGEGVIASWKRALAYFRNDNSSTTYNPNKDVTSIKQGYPICLPGYLGTSNYQSDHCAFLRSVYGEGEEGWLKFMRSCLPADSEQGNMGQDFGKETTALLASKTFSTTNKDETALCPAALYCHSVETATIAKGEFWLPTVNQVARIVRTLEYNTTNNRNADPLNQAMVKINGSAISNGSYWWSCCRNYASNAWYVNGSNGFFSGNHMCNTYIALPVSLYELA